MHFIAIGANLPSAAGSARMACEAAASSLAAATGLRHACRSRWYSSAPVPASDQARFINGVVRLEGAIDPVHLLDVLHGMERAAGRMRGVANAARVLDLDIIDMGGLVREGLDCVLPHPRAHLRAFVLLPLRDVCPGWPHPVTGIGISDLIKSLPPQDVSPAIY